MQHCRPINQRACLSVCEFPVRARTRLAEGVEGLFEFILKRRLLLYRPLEIPGKGFSPNELSHSSSSLIRTRVKASLACDAITHDWDEACASFQCLNTPHSIVPSTGRL